MAKKFPLKILLTAIDKATGPLKKVGRTVKAINKPFKKLNNSFRLFAQRARFDRVGKSFGRLKGSFGRFGSEVGALGRKFALLGIAGVAGITAIVRSSAKLGDRLAKQSKITGLSVEALQEYEFAAERSGVSTSEFNVGLLQFTKRLGEAKAGTGSMITLLKKTSPEFLKQLNIPP